MELIRGLHGLRPHHRGCVASIGNYDGVHRGHQAVIAQLVGRGRELGLPAVVITFEPHPRDFFASGGERAPSRIIGIRDKLEALRTLGVSRVWCLRFNRALAAVSATGFIERYLAGGLAVRYLVVGDDFRFGRGREGDFALLAARAAAAGYEVASVGALLVDGERISSTVIRKLLRDGEIAHAARLLGRPVRFCGRVVRGEQRGRGWGFATANLHLKGLQPLPRGVFMVRVDGLPGGGEASAVANIGVRPTVGGEQLRLETHVLDFDGDLYGRRLGVTLLQKLRDERRFPDVGVLRAQVGRDIARARAWFAAAERHATG